MKFRGVGALPSSVALWLEQQLEERGVDSAVHAGHILGLLHRQPVESSVNLPPLKGRKKKGSRSTEELDRKTTSNCQFELEETVDLDQLVDELCVKLREAASANEGDKGCLKEKTNSVQHFGDILIHPGSSVRRFSDLSLSNRELQDAVNLWTRGPQTGHRARARRRGYSESSPKVTKRKENKENVCGAMRGRMRSRSTVKQSSGCPSAASHKMRSSAKSLDRNDDEAVVRFVKGEMRGRKHVFGDEREAKMSRTPGRRENKIELLEFDKALPMDVQQLLQSPDDSAVVRQPKLNQPLPNFIQCGTNIMSSIWSDTSLERMDEDDVVPAPWEAMASSKWSDARSSILSSAWKLPFAHEKDIESTSLALANDNSSSYFSFFGTGSPLTMARVLNHNKNSGFTEVTPGTHVDRKKVQVTHPPPETEEEDLLTSMKTHFRPIKENLSNTDYKDGSSFAISTNFEQVKYRRSESGALYLGADNKYFEFKRKGDTSAFVPKFKVRQTEKFCQTDDIPYPDEVMPVPAVVAKVKDVELHSEDQDEISDNSGETAAGTDEFFFPGDDRLAEEMVNGSEEDEEEDDKPCIQISGCITSWPMSLAIWSNNSLNNNNNNSWMYGEEGNKEKISADGGHNEQYTRLKDELFEEGEELLSDLSSIQLLVDHEHVEDANQPLHSNIRYQLPCSIFNGNPSNGLSF